jgi:hypothetical protein
MSRLRHHRWLTWIAAYALLVQALLPHVAMAAMAASAGTSRTPWVEVCTALGVRKIAAPDGKRAPASPHAGDHCPFCRLQTIDGAPLPPPLSLHSLAISIEPAIATLPAFHLARTCVPRAARAPPLS